MTQPASVDQDVSCRVVGRCTYGGIIDREIRDLIAVDPVIPNRPLSLAEDLGRAFISVRYNAELTPDGLGQLKLRGIDALAHAQDGRRRQRRRPGQDRRCRRKDR